MINLGNQFWACPSQSLGPGYALLSFYWQSFTFIQFLPINNNPLLSANKKDSRFYPSRKQPIQSQCTNIVSAE